MALGGGLSALSSICGYTSDNILSARLITADGTIVTASRTSNPELFWALRGAGQFFGLVIDITFQAYDLSVLGTSDKTVWTGNIVFPTDRLDEVLRIMEQLVTSTNVPTTGLFILTAPPPTFQTVILILPIYFGPAKDAESFYAPLLALNPLVSDLKNIPYNRMNDSVDPFCQKGDFKRFAGAGASSFKPEVWPRILEYFEELKTKCPDAGATAYAFEWNSYVPVSPKALEDTAFAHRNVTVWFVRRMSHPPLR